MEVDEIWGRSFEEESLQPTLGGIALPRFQLGEDFSQVEDALGVLLLDTESLGAAEVEQAFHIDEARSGLPGAGEGIALVEGGMPPAPDPRVPGPDTQVTDLLERECSCGRQVDRLGSLLQVALPKRVLELPCASCMARLLFSERPAVEVAELCGMSLRTFKLRMRKQGFSTFPSKGARSINRAIREVERHLQSAEAVDDGGTRERFEGRLADCIAERKRFLSNFERKFATQDKGLVVAPSKSFLNLRKRLGKWGQKAQRRAIRQLVTEGLSAEALSQRGADRVPPPPPAPAPGAVPARAGRAELSRA